MEDGSRVMRARVTPQACAASARSRNSLALIILSILWARASSRAMRGTRPVGASVGRGAALALKSTVYVDTAGAVKTIDPGARGTYRFKVEADSSALGRSRRTRLRQPGRGYLQ